MKSAWSAPEKVALLMNMVAYLRKHGATEVSHLADHFGTSPELIRHLAAFIGTAGIPGDTGAYSHEDLYDIDWDALELDDVVDLTHLVGVDATPRFTSMQAAVLLAGLDSLQDMLEPADAAIAESAANKLQAASAHTGATLTVGDRNEPFADRLAVIREARDQCKQLHFSYLDHEGQFSQRILDVHRLLHIQGAWYTQGWCHDREANRSFRVEYMRDLVVSDRAQRNPARAEGQRPLSSHDAESASVEALVNTEMLYRIRNWNPHILGKRGAKTRVSVRLMHPSRAITLVTEAPGAIEIVAPEHMRVFVADWAQSLQQVLNGQVTKTALDEGSVH